MATVTVAHATNGIRMLRYVLSAEPHTSDEYVKERNQLVSGINIPSKDALNLMPVLWKQSSKRTKNQLYSIVQSFADLDYKNPDDVALAHEAGVEFAKRTLKKLGVEDRQVIVATQTDGESHKVHNHILINNLGLNLKAIPHGIYVGKLMPINDKVVAEMVPKEQQTQDALVASKEDAKKEVANGGKPVSTYESHLDDANGDYQIDWSKITTELGPATNLGFGPANSRNFRAKKHFDKMHDPDIKKIYNVVQEAVSVARTPNDFVNYLSENGVMIRRRRHNQSINWLSKSLTFIVVNSDHEVKRVRSKTLNSAWSAQKIHQNIAACGKRFSSYKDEEKWLEDHNVVYADGSFMSKAVKNERITTKFDAAKQAIALKKAKEAAKAPLEEVKFSHHKEQEVQSSNNKPEQSAVKSVNKESQSAAKINRLAEQTRKANEEKKKRERVDRMMQSSKGRMTLEDEYLASFENYDDIEPRQKQRTYTSSSSDASEISPERQSITPEERARYRREMQKRIDQAWLKNSWGYDSDKELAACFEDSFGSKARTNFDLATRYTTDHTSRFVNTDSIQSDGTDYNTKRELSTETIKGSNLEQNQAPDDVTDVPFNPKDLARILIVDVNEIYGKVKDAYKKYLTKTFQKLIPQNHKNERADQITQTNLRKLRPYNARVYLRRYGDIDSGETLKEEFEDNFVKGADAFVTAESHVGDDTDRIVDVNTIQRSDHKFDINRELQTETVRGHEIQSFGLPEDLTNVNFSRRLLGANITGRMSRIVRNVKSHYHQYLERIYARLMEHLGDVDTSSTNSSSRTPQRQRQRDDGPER